MQAARKRQPSKNGFETYDDLDASAIASEELIAVLEEGDLSGEAADVAKTILEKRKHLNKKTMWMYGGDGWAYDIGFGGLDQFWHPART